MILQRFQVQLANLSGVVVCAERVPIQWQGAPLVGRESVHYGLAAQPRRHGQAHRAVLVEGSDLPRRFDGQPQALWSANWADGGQSISSHAREGGERGGREGRLFGQLEYVAVRDVAGVVQRLEGGRLPGVSSTAKLPLPTCRQATSA